MVPQLKQMIENNEVTEMELVDFIRTLKKLSKDNFMDKRNIKLVTKHFGFKKKKAGEITPRLSKLRLVLVLITIAITNNQILRMLTTLCYLGEPFFGKQQSVN